MTTPDVLVPYTRTCGHANTRRFMNYSACADCTPAKLAGHPEPPEPKCAKPLLCYGPCCVAERPKIEHALDADELTHAWRARARSEIVQLARLGSFGLGDLAAVLPVHVPRAHARELVTALLDDGVNAGVLVRDRGRWRARRDDEHLQHVAPTTAYVERENRYQ